MLAALVAGSAVLGLLVGSFLTVATERIPIRDRSAAPVWRLPLARVPRTRRDLLIVAATAVLFALTTARFEDTWPLVAYLYLDAVLVAATAIDLEHYRIPDRLTFPSLAVLVVLVVVISFVVEGPAFEFIQRALVGMVAFAAVLLVFHLISPRGMGFGDVKLALVLGLMAGWLAGGLLEAVYLVVVALFVGGLTGAVLGVVVAVRRGAGSHFPFGPALCLGTYVVTLFAVELQA